jgi:DNA repair protein RadC
MHLELSDSSFDFDASDVIPGRREAALAASLSTLVGEDRAALLLRRVGANGLEHMTAAEIASSGGVNLAIGERVVAARSFAKAVRERPLPVATRPARLFAALPADFGRLEREVVLGIALTGAHRVKAVVVISMGGLSAASLVARDAFIPMVRHAAVEMALAHNHPSGDRTPSEEDILFTNTISRLGLMLGVPLIDHLVVARDGYTSFQETGLLLDNSELALGFPFEEGDPDSALEEEFSF